MSLQHLLSSTSSSAEKTDQTTQNLYQLGLISKPKKGPGASSDKSSRSNSSNRTVAQANSTRHPPQTRTGSNRAAPTQSTFNPSAWRRQLGPESFDNNPGADLYHNFQSRDPPQASFSNRAGRPMAGMMDMDRSRSRRERTFIGSECAVCEEPLEHTLRGERILQFSCGHVSHEACFYEYIKEFESQYCPTCNAPLGLDTSRGGNVLDLEKLSSIVRSVAQESNTQRSSQTTPTQWDGHVAHNRRESHETSSIGAAIRITRENSSNRDSRDSQRERIERLGLHSRQHNRNESTNTGGASSGYDADPNHGPTRRHEYDIQAMETDLSSPRNSLAKNPIPAPIVTVRSEFPTLTRSRHQQSLTCLVTVEVPDNNWHANPQDLNKVPPIPPLPTEDGYGMMKSPVSRHSNSRDMIYEAPEILEEVTEELRSRVDNWHGLEFQRFGRLRLHGTVRVGKDRQSWQELECFLFAEMLICVKEKKGVQPQYVNGDPSRKLTRCTLKGSILIKKHLKQVDSSPDEPILTLNLSVNELPSFHLQFQSRNQLELWKRALLDLHNPEPLRSPQDYEHDTSGTDDDDYRTMHTKRVSSVNSSWGGGPRSQVTAPTEYTASVRGGPHDNRMPNLIHVPLDIVVVIPVSSSMQGLKITLLRDTLKFLVQNLGERDRMGLVTFGSSGGGVPLVGMTSKSWPGWNKILNAVRPVGQKSLRADVVEGANVAMDLLMQRKSSNPISTILLISDSSTSDADGVDFVVQRAEAAKVTIHSFGLGLTHKPDTMIELSTRTKASYLYVKDWMMLRECVAGCLGSLQTISHQNVKLKLRLPEGSPAKFVKISGALQVSKRATGKDAEASIGDLRFGDKRDVLIQLVITPDNSSQEHLPQDPWETIVSGLEALGGPLGDDQDQRPFSVEEVPLLQADLTWGDLLRDGNLTHLPRPSLLAITMLPHGGSRSSKNSPRPLTPPIPPHPSVVQRRMELLTSDMLTRAMTLVSRGQHERAHHLLHETRTILKGLGKGGLPPLPPAATNGTKPPSQPNSANPNASSPSPTSERPPSESSTVSPGSTVDSNTMSALDSDIESSLEWINHPAVFSRDSRKQVLQAIGVIGSQRGYTFRTASEGLWAGRIRGIKRLVGRAREWREEGEGGIVEE